VGERAPVVVCHRQAVLLGTALLAFPPLAVAASYLVGLTGTLALTVGVVRRRPDPVTGWRLLVADAWEKSCRMSASNRGFTPSKINQLRANGVVDLRP
jgi:hypothetical protein